MVNNVIDHSDAQPSFFRTRIPVKLMEYEGEALLARTLQMRFSEYSTTIIPMFTLYQ